MKTFKALPFAIALLGAAATVPAFAPAAFAVFVVMVVWPMQAWLQAQHRGVLAFELSWTMDARRDTATEGRLLVRTAEPTRDMTHLQRLLGEHLARVTLPAPALYLRLRSLETQTLQDRSASLLPDEQQAGDSLHQLLERLSARLGPEQEIPRPAPRVP